MVTFHPIQFHGYEQPDAQGSYKYAVLSQGVDYSSSTSEITKQIFGYQEKTRSLKFLLQANNDSFHQLLEKQPDARIIRTISHEPILTTQEMLLVEHELELLSNYAEKQLLVSSNGKIVLDEYGLPIYIKDRLFLTGKDMVDQDLRIPPCSADLEDGDDDLEFTPETSFFNFED